MQHVEVVRTFTASPEKVWDAYTDHSGWSGWAGLQHSALETEGREDRNGTGAVRSLGSYGLNAYEEILEFEPPKRMTYRVIRGGLPMKDHFVEVLFKRVGEATEVTWRCRFNSRVPFLGPLMRMYIIRFFRTALDGLAEHTFPDTPS